jgi:hypothetical protein
MRKLDRSIGKNVARDSKTFAESPESKLRCHWVA